MKTKNNKIQHIKKINHFLLGATPLRRLLRYYILIVLLGSILLMLPFSLTNGFRNGDNNDDRWTFLDSLFTSSSAFSDTGLTVSSTHSTFNVFGQLVILILIQIGGFGYTTIKFLIWRTFSKSRKETFDQKVLLQAEKASPKFSANAKTIMYASLFILFIQLIGFIFMTFYFFLAPAYIQKPSLMNPDLSVDSSEYVAAYHNFGTSMWWGFFHSISASNNAGFDIIGDFSISPYRNDSHIVLQLFIMFQFIIGGIGFPLIFDVIEFIKKKRIGVRHKFSLFTKITFIAYVSVALITLSGTLIAEHMSKESIIRMSNEGWGNHPCFNKNFSIIFTSFSTRNAGYFTVNPHLFSDSSKWLQSVAMIIGSSPSSTAGGIRTTTIAIAMISLYKKSVGRKNVSIFGRTIPDKTVFQSFFVIFISILLMILSVFIIGVSMNSLNEFALSDYIFEAASAFGTTGLPTGLSSKLTWLPALNLIALMFIGQLGVSTWSLSLKNKKPKYNSFKFIEEDVLIG